MLCILRLVAKLVFFDEIALQLRVQKKATTEKRLSLCRDDKIRTCDPYVPNVVRYQLRYIPIASVATFMSQKRVQRYRFFLIYTQFFHKIFPMICILYCIWCL